MTVLFLAACSGKPPQPSNVAPSIQSAARTDSGIRVTSIGKNGKGRFSPDGRKIIFVSSGRDSHRHSQIYELDLAGLRERRLTFSDGDALEGIYSPDGKSILYVSTTDELKERPALLNPSGAAFLPSELYLSDPHGSRIRRLTDRPGFEGSPSWVSARQVLHLAEWEGRNRIHSLNLTDGKSTVWRAETSASLETPTVDATGRKVAWLILDKSGTLELGLKINGKHSRWPLPFARVQSLEWIKGYDGGDALLASAQGAKDPYLKGWILDPEKKCAGPLFEEPGDLMDLRVGQGKILYTFAARGDSQLYLREFPSLPVECVPVTAEVPRISAGAGSAGGLPGYRRRPSGFAVPTP